MADDCVKTYVHEADKKESGYICEHEGTENGAYGSRVVLISLTMGINYHFYAYAGQLL